MFNLEAILQRREFEILRLPGGMEKNGKFQEIKRRPYNYFESDKMGAGPFTFRITDIYGQMIIDENIPLSTDDSVIIEGHVQFPK